ncbi:MAG: DUF1273 family protein [Clostridia bacterium]|nr:DUF1273 family protein [Clostridia bacterium]
MGIYRRASHRAKPSLPWPAHDLPLNAPSSFITRAMVRGVFRKDTADRRSITACFTGHRIIAKDDLPLIETRLDVLLEELYCKGYRDFISGAALGFDILAAEHVLHLKSRHSDVRLILAIPCADQTARWHRVDCMHYERLLFACDDIRVLAKAYYDGCMQVRNQFMVDSSSMCICYLKHFRGGTLATVKYAVQQDIPVLNVLIDDKSAVPSAAIHAD